MREETTIDLATIRARWADQEWVVDDDDGEIIIMKMKEKNWVIEIADPVRSQDLVFLTTAVHAPADIRALLARLDSAYALLADMRAWLELRAAQTALTPVMDRLLTAICRELEG